LGPQPLSGGGWCHLPPFFFPSLREMAFWGHNFSMKRYFFALAIILVSAVSLLAQSEKDKAAIRKVMDDQAAAWNRGDIDAFMQGYWRSDQLLFVSTTSVTRGWQPTLDRYKKGYDTKAKMGTLTFSDLEITLLSKKSASVIGSWSLARNGDNPHGKFLLVFRKFKEGWRIVQDHTS
jgi:ketosteroid isomerase-like protein